MGTRLSLLLVWIGLLLAAVPVLAHHAFSGEFDATQPVTLRGTITKVEWVNPHSWFYIDVKGPDGKVTNWGIEGGAPNALIRQGWRRDSLPLGTEIVVTAYRAKNGTARANGRSITFPDGRNLFVGSSGTGAPGDPKQ